MSAISTFEKNSVLQNCLLIAGIILIALNLRPSLAAVGPLIGAIRDSTGLSNTALGLLTTLPLLAFGILSTLTPIFSRRFGIEGMLAFSMILLTGGILMRVASSAWMLFGGTIILGVAVAFGNVLLPSLVKRDFPNHTGVMTSVYSSFLGVGATLGAGISVPLAFDAGLGWHWSLGAWAVLSVAAFLIWLPQLRKITLPKHSRSFIRSIRELSGSKIAWQVALFMGLQSLTFYVILAWLPDILQSRGLSESWSGWLLSISQGTGIFGSIFIPIWAERLDDQRPVVWLILVLEFMSLVGLLLPNLFWIELWVSLIGIALGGSFALALLLIVLRTSNAETATELSGMAQSVGYLVAATGPALFGAIHDLSSTWFVPILFLFVIAAIKLFIGLGAARPKEIH